MILIPSLLPFKFDQQNIVETVLRDAAERGYGSVILVPSDKAAEAWGGVAKIAKGPEEVQERIDRLQKGSFRGAVVFSNRYDGIDLPGDSCRLLIMDGLPGATSDYESMRSSVLHGGSSISRMLAQRIEQGIGRGARGAGDHCVILLLGARLAQWISLDANFRLLTEATRVQLEMGEVVSKAVEDVDSLYKTISQSYDRSSDWISFHAETLAEGVKGEESSHQIDQAVAERKAFNLWMDGLHDKSISRIENILDSTGVDKYTKGWMQQLAARIANDCGFVDRAEDFQRQAYSNNNNLIRPKNPLPHRGVQVPSAQAQMIAHQICTYRMRRGFLQKFEIVVSDLVPHVSANKFEEAFARFGKLIGFSTERCDNNGVGPDVIWVLPNKSAWIVEAKSRKDAGNVLSKEEHGQLLVAENWFHDNYKELSCKRVSVHPNNVASRAAAAQGTYALTFGKLASLVADARSLIKGLCESQLSENDLVLECTRLLSKSPIEANKISDNYLLPFICSGGSV